MAQKEAKEYVHTSKIFIGKPAPDFKAMAVNEKKEIVELTLSQYRGKYVVLFFYPLDFTFVCPTEICEFSDRAAEFHKENCVLLGASIDSEYSHLAWMEQPRIKGGIGQTNMPIVSDLKRTISRDYGCLMEEEGHTTRATFIISDKGIVRHISNNDPPVGRSIDEVLRLVRAFQYTDRFGEVCPASWNPGKKTMKADPKKSLEFFASAGAPAAAAAATPAAAAANGHSAATATPAAAAAAAAAAPASASSSSAAPH